MINHKTRWSLRLHRLLCLRHHETRS